MISTTGICGTMLFAIIMVFHLSVQLLPATGIAVTSSAATIYNSTFISLEAWHAESLTNISWSLRGIGSAGTRDHVIVFWDSWRTDLLRFGSSVNRTTRSSSSSSSSSPSSTEEYSIFPDEMGAGSDVCNYSAYVVDPLHPFDNENRSNQTTVELLSNSMWWYTSTLGQDANATSTSTASEAGSAVVLLGDPGFYIACLVLGDENCSAADCLEFQVYQPHYDILQVSSTNIGAVVTVRFNVASFDANLGDWVWFLGGVDPEFTVAEANSLSSSEIYNQFSEGCWLYVGRAVILGHPFLCSRDPDSELAALQASTPDRVFQYGWFEIYSAAAGNVSVWYAVDENYNFAMVHSYYTCGVDIRAPASSVVNTTSDIVIMGVVEKGERCGLGDGIPLRIRTVAVTFPYFGIPASIVFWGQMDNMSASDTYLSVRLPVTGTHSVLVELESGGILASLNMTATSGEPYAPNSIVFTTFPTSIDMHALISISFTSRDFYSNNVTIGYGDDAFDAWSISGLSHKVKDTVYDLGNGSYRVEMHAQNETGTMLFFVQRDGLNIPGSPFEAYVVGSDQCVIESLDIKVGECTSDLYRTVVHEWKEGTNCEGGLALPTDTRIPCSYIPTYSSLGRAMVAASIFGALYSAFYLVWITRHREYAIVQRCQPFVCKLFLTGCIFLNFTGPMLLGKPSNLICRARPFVLHTALTFSVSCLYMKTYRVHRLFNTPLVRMSISDRSLVVWVLRLVAVDVVILTLWMFLDDPHKAMTREVYGYAEVLSPVCAPGDGYFSTILWVYKGALNFFGVVMAAKTWNCADGVGESQSICLSVYNTTLLGLVNLVLHLLVSEHPMSTICARGFAAVGGTVFTVSVVFGPKVYKVYYFGDIQRVLERRSSSLSRRKGMTSTGRNIASIRGDIPVSFCSNLQAKPNKRISPYATRLKGKINPCESTEITQVPNSLEPTANSMEQTAHSMEPTARPLERAGKLPPIPGSQNNRENSLPSNLEDGF